MWFSNALPITKRRFDLNLVGWIAAIMCVLPLLEIWVATGNVPSIVRGWIEFYARGGDPLVAHMAIVAHVPFRARYVFIVHALLNRIRRSVPAEVVVHVVIRRAVRGAQGAARLSRDVRDIVPRARPAPAPVPVPAPAPGRAWRGVFVV